jgi:hypothetical protein
MAESWGVTTSVDDMHDALAAMQAPTMSLRGIGYGLLLSLPIHAAWVWAAWFR